MAALSPDGQQLALQTPDGGLVVLDLTTGEQRALQPTGWLLGRSELGGSSTTTRTPPPALVAGPPDPLIVHRPVMDPDAVATRGLVRLWTEEGWGVIDSPETPGGCWTHWSHVMVPGFRELTAGQEVELEWESPGQDGCDFRAVRTWPLGSEPVDETFRYEGPSDAYSSTLTITFDEPGAPEPR